MTGKHCNCTKCGKHDYCMPLHGERGGPFCCLLCIGKWDAEHIPRFRARRVLIKALQAYDAVGGHLYGKDLDEMRFAATRAFDRNTTAATDFSDLTSELLTAAIALTHPDKHPPERKAEAQRVTQELIALKPFVFPAPRPSECEPSPKPSDASSKQTGEDFNKPSEPAYPCEDCRDTIPSLYCDACRAQWEKKQREREEREEQQRLKKNARQRQRYGQLKAYRQRRLKPTFCATCGELFKPKRSDAQYCSAPCRQRAYVKREGKASNAKPLNREDIERIITDVLTSNPDKAFTTDDLCDHVFPGLGSAATLI